MLHKWVLHNSLLLLATLFSLKSFAGNEIELKNWKPQYVQLQSGCSPSDRPQELLIISEKEAECSKEASKMNVQIIAKDRIALSKDSVMAISFPFTSVLLCHPKKTCSWVDLNGRVETQAPLLKDSPQQMGVPKINLYFKFVGEQSERKFELKVKACESRVVCG